MIAADAGAGDVVGLQPDPLEDPQHPVVRVAAHAAGPECEADLEPAQVARHPTQRLAGGRRGRAARLRAARDGRRAAAAGCASRPSASGRGGRTPRPRRARCGRAARLDRAARRTSRRRGEASRPSRPASDEACSRLIARTEHQDVLVVVLQVLDRAGERGRREPFGGCDEQQARARPSTRGERLAARPGRCRRPRRARSTRGCATRCCTRARTR